MALKQVLAWVPVLRQKSLLFDKLLLLFYLLLLFCILCNFPGTGLAK